MPHPALLAGCFIAGAATVVALEVAVFRPWREKCDGNFIDNGQHQWETFRRQWSSTFDDMNPAGSHGRWRKRRGSNSSSGEETVRESEAFEMERRLAAEEHQAMLDDREEMQSFSEEETGIRRHHEENGNCQTETTGASTQINHDGDASRVRRRRGSVNGNIIHDNAQDDRTAASVHTTGDPYHSSARSPRSDSTGFDILSTSSDAHCGDDWSAAPLSPSLHTYSDPAQWILNNASRSDLLEDDGECDTTSSLLHSPLAQSPPTLSGFSWPVKEGEQLALSRATSPLASVDDWQSESLIDCSSESERSEIFAQGQQKTNLGGEEISTSSSVSDATSASAYLGSAATPCVVSEGGDGDAWERLSQGSSSGSSSDEAESSVAGDNGGDVEPPPPDGEYQGSVPK